MLSPVTLYTSSNCLGAMWTSMKRRTPCLDKDYGTRSAVAQTPSVTPIPPFWMPQCWPRVPRSMLSGLEGILARVTTLIHGRQDTQPVLLSPNYSSSTPTLSAGDCVSDSVYPPYEPVGSFIESPVVLHTQEIPFSSGIQALFRLFVQASGQRAYEQYKTSAFQWP